MQIHLKIIGILLIALSIAHMIFPRYFNWKEDLKSLALINRQIIKVHTFFIALILFLMGALCLAAAHDLVTTALGHLICIGLSIFWFCRLVIQFVGYSPKLWRGKPFETTVHIVFAATWAYFTIVFAYIFVFVRPEQLF